jgi:uncharacterized protein YdiU (UPF0061 family)
MKFEGLYQALPSFFYSKFQIQSVPNPQWFVFNEALAKDLGWDKDKHGPQFLSGGLGCSNVEPIALAYAGHQYGHLTMLGDGRACYVGSLLKEGCCVDVHLKGAGPTVYARGGDGKATLASMLKEYICSEAMHGLNIPTSRSLAVCTTGESISRDGMHQGAVLTRLASTHLRFGTFEYAQYFGSSLHTQWLLDFCKKNYDPHTLDVKQSTVAWVQNIVNRYIDLMVHWLRVGFVHGVMNTDNMSIAGETIDFGPCAFLDAYNPHAVFSFIDRHGRYAWDKQPMIARWNLECLVSSLSHVVNESDWLDIKQILEGFMLQFKAKYHEMLCKKIGLASSSKHLLLANELLDWMFQRRADYTQTFCMLTYEPDQLRSSMQNDDCFCDWFSRWESALATNGLMGKETMRRFNPVIIPRNHQVKEVIDQAISGNKDPLNQLMAALAAPYEYNAINQPFRIPPTDEQRVIYTYCGT